jgi:hypothetical protein
MRHIVQPKFSCKKFSFHMYKWNWMTYSKSPTSLWFVINWSDAEQNRIIWDIYTPFVMKTNTLTMLMHQMRISTTQVSSVMLRSKKLDIWKKMWLKEPSDENQTGCHEIEPNPSKDRSMLEGDNPSFYDEFIKFTFFLTVQFIFVLKSKYRST